MAVRPTGRGRNLGIVKVSRDTTINVLTEPGRIELPGGILVPRPIDYIGNLFDTARPGTPVVRGEDLLALRIELRNLDVHPGTPPMLKPAPSGTPYLILHFPPQSITEEAFFEPARPGMGTPDVDTTLPVQKPADVPPPPNSEPVPPAFDRTVRARIAGESRLVFQVPADANITYTLEGILQAVQAFDLNVAANARPRQLRGAFSLSDLLVPGAALSDLSANRRASLASFAAASLRIARSPTGSATLLRRQVAAGVGVAEVGPVRPDILGPGIFRVKPVPKQPAATSTAIEMPWRLVLSPHTSTRWRHANEPATSLSTNHTELWHSRLVSPNSKGEAIEPPYPDASRTVRAIWAKTGEGSAQAAKDAISDPSPNFASVQPSQQPFRMPMDDFDRAQITHLSSNFRLSGYTPNPVETNLMMLTALGGWLDSRGGWSPPGGFSVEEWVHRASMGRDHYVKVVYKGFLFPFGHRVSLVKITERKFHNGARSDPIFPFFPQGVPQIEQISGNPAYLRQRMFIVIREPLREYTATELRSANNVNLPLQFPFSSVRILTERTPNLDNPTFTEILPNEGQRFFWPSVGGQSFKFQCVATDLDDCRVLFDLPMIFMDNTFAAPFETVNGKRQPNFHAAEMNAGEAAKAYRNSGSEKTAKLKLQRVALATSLKRGDTSTQVDTMDFGGFAEVGNTALRNHSDQLSRPPFVPIIEGLDARIGAMAHLGGTTATNRLEYHPFYLQNGFNQPGEVFAKVVVQPGMAKLDFSTQGDRSGGFVQPNLEPKGLSRLAGPITADPMQFIQANVLAGGGFSPSIGDLPLPLLFGCIPLASIIDGVTDLAGKAPKFGTESSNQLESFINDLVRLLGFVTDLAEQPANIASAATEILLASLTDHIAQAQALTAARAAEIEAAINQVKTDLAAVASAISSALNQPFDISTPVPNLVTLPAAVATAQAAIDNLRTVANASVAGVSLPAGLRQSLLNITQKTEAFLTDLATLPQMVSEGHDLFVALDNIVGQPESLGALFEDAPELKLRVEAVGNAIDALKTTLAGLNLMAGAPRKAILDAMSTVKQAFGIAEDLINLIEQLTGEELTIRFDWTPEISSFPSSDPIFRVRDKKGFSIAVEAKVKKHGNTTPKISVTCGLKHFDLVLIAPASFLELHFEKIEFRVDSAAKMDVDVLLHEIQFVGPLSFVEVLRDLIPLDGFSDPPYLDISTKGIDAGFSVALPSVAIGVLNLSGLSLGAGFTVPFIGQPLSVRFNFCTREQPFLLTVYMFGGGGFFGVTIDPSGVQILEASFEFGASISIDLGVASGGVSVMAGIYYRMEKDAASLTGYFRLAGHVDVLGLITASLELYLELKYEFQSGKCSGKAKLTIEISLFIFSGSVTVSCERKFAGSNGDPSLRQMLGFMPELSLEDELAAIDSAAVDYAWRTHCEAFA